MNKRFVANVSLLFVVNLLVKPFWIFGIDRTVQNTVGAAAYGIYFALFNYSFLLQTLLDFGVNNYNSRAVAQNRHWLDEHFGGIMAVKLLLAAGYLLLCFTGAVLIGYSRFQLHLLLLLCINQVLVSYIGYFRSNLQGLHLFKADSLLSVLDKLLMIGICAVILWSGLMPFPLQVAWFVYAQTAGYALTFVAGLAIAGRYLHRPVFNLDYRYLVSILRKSYPFALAGVLMSVYNRIDTVMLEKMLPADGAHEAGIYASAYRLLDAVNMIGVLLSTILLPMFSRMLIKKEPVAPLVSFSAKTLYALATAGAVCCYFYSNQLMHLLYVEANGYYASVFGWLMLSFIAISSVYVFGSLLAANHNLWHVNTIAVCSVVLNVALNYLLIPQYKALGAAWAALLTQSLAATLFAIAAVVKLRLRVAPLTVVAALVYAGVYAALANAGSKYLPLPWYASFLLTLAAALPIAWALGLLQLNKVWQTGNN
ncbi:hypothetical protein C7N43_36820 [Sphingobacteriales bacterium UPWRP_1]|nr:hypothetical protein B6N25_00540 [Sphingobacteriales bacterium TSM_CSS]PSJ71935.1 hypothetical protein C7N43_36820 [Sphingobacteriales bacterium UPWRP_1]